MKRHLIYIFICFVLHTQYLLAETPIGAERNSQSVQEVQIGAERKSMGVQETPVDNPWTAPAALVFYIFLIPIAASFGYQAYRNIMVQKERMKEVENQQELHEQHLHFVANISHEIRTPLTLISAPLKELIDNNQLNEHDRDLLAIMQRNVTRLNHLAEQILNNSNHADKDTVLKETFGDISAFVENIANNFRFYAHEKGLHLTFDSKTNGEQGYFDMEKVENIISNLMTNAIKYTPEGGDVVVRVTLDNGNASIVVKDTGIGITDSRQREMFRRFNRLDMSVLNPSSKGFGVGLHYAQCLAFLHRGHLTYEPNIPKGARFKLTIPYKEPVVDNIVETDIDDIKLDKTPNKNLPKGYMDENLSTILLVEDDYEMRSYVNMLLKEDYNIITACDGEEALEKLQLNIPDLVLSDVVMRRMDGFELCGKIKESPDYGYLPVVLLTAKSDMDNRKHGVDCGADAYIGKPFDPYYLKSVLASVLENRQRIQRIIRSMTHIHGLEATGDKVGETSAEPLMSDRDREFLDRFHKLLSSHLEDDNINVNQMATEMNLSYSSLYAKVKDLTGQSPQVFFNTYRMNVAMELLQTHNYTVSEVCYKVGASSPTNFARSFKKQFGIVPSAV